MSPYRIHGPDKGLKIRRKVPEIVNGTKTGSTFIDLYDNICGRVGDIEEDADNTLGDPEYQGEIKANERKIILTPNRPLNKMVTGDYIVIPWGTKPNTFSPPNVPDFLGPSLVIDTPLGRRLLNWDGTQYYNNNVTIYQSGGSWCISSDPVFCFASTNLACTPFPEGYTFVRSTGPLAYFKILRMNEARDDRGRTAHYTCFVEYEDRRGQHMQQ